MRCPDLSQVSMKSCYEKESIFRDTKINGQSVEHAGSNTAISVREFKRFLPAGRVIRHWKECPTRSARFFEHRIISFARPQWNSSYGHRTTFKRTCKGTRNSLPKCSARQHNRSKMP